MKIFRLIGKTLLVSLAVTTLSANAGNIDATAARAAAGRFLHQNAHAMFKATPQSAIKLAHSEASKVSGNAYYVFNIDGGGWVIIAGDDRAQEVLAYGNYGSVDVNNMPDNMKGYLDMFKAQIECMQAYKGEVVPLKTPKSNLVVEPLVKTNWAQGNPFNRQCPQYGGEYSSVGCGGLAMAQIVNYWKYPTDMPALESYPNTANYSYVPALPAATIDYSLIVDHYTDWNDAGQVVLLNTTQEQKDEVAKLCRYCAQSCLMNFSPDGSGSNVLKQKNGFLAIGYHSDAKLVGLEAWPSRETWNTTDYTDAEWIALINEQLAAGRPIPYSSEDFTDGHAFVVDGIDANGMYHVNWGWYGRCDGWYQYGAFNVTPTNETYYFNSSLFMIIDLYPYPGYVIPSDEPETMRGDVNKDGEIGIADVTALIDYILSGDATDIDLEAAECDMVDGITIADVTTLIDYILNGEW